MCQRVVTLTQHFGIMFISLATSILLPAGLRNPIWFIASSSLCIPSIIYKFLNAYYLRGAVLGARDIIMATTKLYRAFFSSGHLGLKK